MELKTVKTKWIKWFKQSKQTIDTTLTIPPLQDFLKNINIMSRYYYSDLKKKVKLNDQELFLIRARSEYYSFIANFVVENSSWYEQYQNIIANQMNRYSVVDLSKGSENTKLSSTALKIAQKPYEKQINRFFHRQKDYLDWYDIYEIEESEEKSYGDVIKIELTSDDESINLTKKRMADYESD